MNAGAALLLSPQIASSISLHILIYVPAIYYYLPDFTVICTQMTALPLLQGSIDLEGALEEDIDMLRQLAYPNRRLYFWLHLYQSRLHIVELVSRHLNLPQSHFTLGEVEEWIHGNYNACIPIHIVESICSARCLPQAMIRFALPFKVGEEFYPGNAAEKLRSEAATYVWLQQNCPEIPTPRLFGFGFPGGRSFTTVKNESFCKRAWWFVRRLISWASGRILPQYIPHDRPHLHDLGYLVLERIDKGNMLSETWEEHRHDTNRRANLFRDLSRIMLRLAKLPVPKIGSWTMDDHGVLTLTNRPLTLFLHQLENANIPTEIPRNRTYTSVEPYILDLIACHDNRIRYQPNSIRYEGDGEKQLAALTAMRALLPKFTDIQFREGPFIYSLTDLHKNNMFVDDDWHITGIFDLEWSCGRPIEMMSPPDWLSNHGLEEIASYLEDYTYIHNEFLDIFEKEELAEYHTNALTKMMRSCWGTGKFWYFHALDSSTSLVDLFIDHILPRFTKLSRSSRADFSRMLTPLWDLDSKQFIHHKVKDNEHYEKQLQALFQPSTIAKESGVVD